jgi:hypothetical protein
MAEFVEPDNDFAVKVSVVNHLINDFADFAREAGDLAIARPAGWTV